MFYNMLYRLFSCLTPHTQLPSSAYSLIITNNVLFKFTFIHVIMLFSPVCPYIFFYFMCACAFIIPEIFPFVLIFCFLSYF